MYRKITWVQYDTFIAEFCPDSTAETAAMMPPVNLDLPPSKLRRSSRTKRKAEACTTTATRNPHFVTNPFAAIPEPRSDDDMYRKLTSALNRADMGEEFGFVSTPHKVDTTEESPWTVKCGMYPKSALRRLSPGPKKDLARMDWSLVELAVACKEDADYDPLDEDIDTDASSAESCRTALEQVMSYAEYIFHYQHRTCLYMLLFLGNSVRIIRIDRSGIFATHKLDYREEGEKVAKFLHFYSRRSAEGRGHDPTAVRLDPASPEAERMKARAASAEPNDYAANAFKASLNPTCPWWRLEVTDEHDSNTKHYFLVGKPDFQASGVTGRVTRGYVALYADPSKDDLVYLKDTWRVVKDNVKKEGAVLETLREHDIQFVPTPVCHGDIPGQKTRSQELWSRLNPEEECHLRHHQHYRLVVKQVGKPLDKFADGRQFLTAMFYAIHAHSDAYKKGIIHGDISVGNILLYRAPDGEWQGLLTDWELSQQLSHQDEPAGRKPYRAGTPAYMSVAALNDRTKSVTIQDELESFFHVILCITLRLLPHSCPDREVPRLLHDFFDKLYQRCDGDYSCGQVKMCTMYHGSLNLGAYADLIDGKIRSHFRVKWPGPENKAHPLDGLLKTLLSWFEAYYEWRDTPNPPAEATKIDKPAGAVDVIVVTPENNPGLWKILSRVRPAGKHTKDDPTRALPAPAPASDTPANTRREQLEETAEMLENHEAILVAIASAIQEPWPEDDRCEDREPERAWTVPEDQAPLPMPLKRDASALREPSRGRPAKRRRH